MPIENSPPFTVLLVDDDEDVLTAYRHLLQLSGYSAKGTHSPTKALALLNEHWNGVVVSDIYMPAMNGMDLLNEVKKIDPEIPVIMITGHGDIPLAVEAVKRGAFDFLEKPLDSAQFLQLLKRAQQIRQGIIEQREAISSTFKEHLFGTSEQINQIRQQLSQIARIDKDVMIEGQIGTGRHLVASVLHSLSQHKNNSLIIHDCKEYPSLTELEASIAKVQNGTLVLRSLTQLSHEHQRWLCTRLLDQERLNTKTHRTICIFDTNPDDEVKSGALLPELYYYFSQARIQLPTLAERKSDIIPLFRNFLSQSCKRFDIPIPKIDLNYIEILKRHHWPGNIRELRNLAELYAVGIIKLPGEEALKLVQAPEAPLDELVDAYEKQVIENILYLCSGRVTDAANYLGIPRKKLYLRMKKLNLEKDKFKPKS